MGQASVHVPLPVRIATCAGARRSSRPARAVRVGDAHRTTLPEAAVLHARTHAHSAMRAGCCRARPSTGPPSPWRVSTVQAGRCVAHCMCGWDTDARLSACEWIRARAWVGPGKGVQFSGGVEGGGSGWAGIASLDATLSEKEWSAPPAPPTRCNRMLHARKLICVHRFLQQQCCLWAQAFSVELRPECACRTPSVRA